MAQNTPLPKIQNKEYLKIYDVQVIKGRFKSWGFVALVFQ